MYKLDRPSMAVNDPRISIGTFICRYQMENTWDISAGESRQHIIEWVAAVARGASGGKLKNLVINCHGAPAYLQLGQGFSSADLPMFSAWNGLIEKIWLTACRVAEIPASAAAGTGDGNLFCSGLAKTVGCYVVASTETQVHVMKTAPVDQMTSYEGLILSYGPEGNITWSSRNPSVWQDSAGLWHQVPD